MRRRALERSGWYRWFAGWMIAVSVILFGASSALAETRTLKLYFVHTGEKAEITFKRNGRYDQAGLKKLNQFLRDWRRNEPTKMDPRLFDLVWETYRAVGASNYINVVSAYRSPATNSMLRSRSKGVAKKSQHMLGKAMDFYIPGVSLKKLRETGMKMQVGGVGYYPRSGSPFVHLDVGNVRHWPKMSRRELVAIFPNGKTLHVPSDGKPLPGFEQAVASYEARKKSGTTALALASTGKSDKKPSTSLLAAFFGGGGADEEEESGPAEEAPVLKAAEPAPKPVVKTETQVARADPQPEALPGIKIVSPEDAKRVEIGVAPEPEQPVVEETPETIIAALPTRDIPLPDFAPRPKAEVGPSPMMTASITPSEPVPADMPFGAAQPPLTDEEMQAPDAVAENVPLPTHRPDYSPLQPSVDGQDAILMALAATEEEPLVGNDAMPLPSGRPTNDLVPGALPSADHKALIDAEIRAGGERVAALASANAASPKLAIAARASGADPASAIGGVKTTRKASRASRNDSKPDRKTVVVTAEPKAAQWVLKKDYVAMVSDSTTAPSFAYNAVVTAPREVYTAGFTKTEGIADANRFTGKAVQFMSVARFE